MKSRNCEVVGGRRKEEGRNTLKTLLSLKPSNDIQYPTTVHLHSILIFKINALLEGRILI